MNSKIGRWEPNPVGQKGVMETEADIVGFGGPFGAGKTDAIFAAAYRRHRKSIIFAYNTHSVVLSGREFFNETNASFRINGSVRMWKPYNNTEISIAGLRRRDEHLKFRGGSWDGMFFDDAESLPMDEIMSVLAWNKTTESRFRRRAYLMFHKPYTESAYWLYKFFAPWIDKNHPYPAEQGELRWFIAVGGTSMEMASEEPVEYEHLEKDPNTGKNQRVKQTYYPHSRTFYTASYEDNPHTDTKMISKMQLLPEPLRTDLMAKDISKEKDINDQPLIS